MDQLPEKLRDSYTHGEGSELFIVEGESAALALDRIRNRDAQAILPMQGKPMNAMKASIDDIVDNVQFAALLAALGLTDAAKAASNEGKDCDGIEAKAFRYERIVLLFDPDADGIHSRTLVLLFFYRWLRPLLEAGKVAAAYPPLWRVTAKGLADPIFAYTQSHLDRIRTHLDKKGVADAKVKRYRGLGNHRGETILRMCVDPATRQLTTLAVADAESALEMFERMRDATR